MVLWRRKGMTAARRRKVKELMFKLARGTSSSARSEGAAILAAYSRGKSLSRPVLQDIASRPEVLEGLVDLFSLNTCTIRQWVALQAFTYLAVSCENIRRMASAPGAVQGLVNLFSRATKLEIRDLALSAFIILAKREEIACELGSTPGILPSLIDLLSEERPEALQCKAVHAAYLILNIRTESLPEHVCPPEATKALVALFFNGELVNRLHAAAIFAYLAQYERNRVSMTSIPGVLRELAHLSAATYRYTTYPPRQEILYEIGYYAAAALSFLTDERRFSDLQVPPLKWSVPSHKKK